MTNLQKRISSGLVLLITLVIVIKASLIKITLLVLLTLVCLEFLVFFKDRIISLLFISAIIATFILNYYFSLLEIPYFFIGCIIWIGLFVGFAIKVPVFPFHTLLPLAHVEAPTAISVILAGVLLKMGTYGLLRISYPLLPFEAINFAYTLAILGVINILWGAVNAIAQIDMKKMVAYSSVSHMGYVILGMASVVSQSEAGAQAGLNGAVMQLSLIHI